MRGPWHSLVVAVALHWFTYWESHYLYWENNLDIWLYSVLRCVVNGKLPWQLGTMCILRSQTVESIWISALIKTYSNRHVLWADFQRCCIVITLFLCVNKCMCKQCPSCLPTPSRIPGHLDLRRQEYITALDKMWLWQHCGGTISHYSISSPTSTSAPQFVALHLNVHRMWSEADTNLLAGIVHILHVVLTSMCGDTLLQIFKSS